ncbi:hypothetical protein FHS89_002205 [Rubricella aquisinus]|uniref:Uncharacterized protein n=1 Tax=Rubricella aquisinus TaxID=2028108 RepID=A0A840WM94_9RHOB|nr:excinuclease ABC subunit A [Rubricella aquisinus]MBB5516179.1 hypothetical protein [Rubricella aquisinus]
MTLHLRVRLLKTFSILYLIGPGLLMVLAELLPVMGAVSAFLDLAYWPYDGAQVVAGDVATLFNAILGGVLIGFGVLIHEVGSKVYAKDEPLGRRILLTGLFAWYLTDSFASAVTGAPFNAVMNTFFAGCFIVTLLWPART